MATDILALHQHYDISTRSALCNGRMHYLQQELTSVLAIYHTKEGAAL
jgi:hypothetical protein